MVAQVRVSKVSVTSIPDPKVQIVAVSIEATNTSVQVSNVSLEVNTGEIPPNADAGTSRRVNCAEIALLDSSATTAGGNAIASRVWSYVGADVATAPAPTVLDAPTGVTMRVRIPVQAVSVVYTYQITVTDSAGLTASSLVALGAAGADLAVPTLSGWVPAGLLTNDGTTWG